MLENVNISIGHNAVLHAGGICILGGLHLRGCWTEHPQVCLQAVLGRTAHGILWDTVNERAVRILHSCIKYVSEVVNESGD